MIAWWVFVDYCKPQADAPGILKSICDLFHREWEKQPGGWKQKTSRWTTEIKDVLVSSLDGFMNIFVLFLLKQNSFHLFSVFKSPPYISIGGQVEF